MGEKHPRGAPVTRRALILVEGHTEERFVKVVLAPELSARDIYIAPTILTTKRVKDGPNFKGGVTNYAKFRQDLNLLLGGAGDALVTTMVDYYRLPNGFPGMDTRLSHAAPIDRVRHVEDAIKAEVSDRRFLPFLSLHEFEALLFSCDVTLPSVMTQAEKQPEFAAIRAGVASPEEINERPGENPVSRIMGVFLGYQKTLHGPAAIKRIGLQRVRSECPHFNEWVTAVEEFTLR